MRIAHVSSFVPNNILSWSGTRYTIPRAIASHNNEVDSIVPLNEKFSFYYKSKKVLYRYALNQRHLRMNEPIILRDYARQVSEKLIEYHDAVFSIWTHPIAFLETTLPIIFWAYATIALMSEFYADWSSLTQSSINNGHFTDRIAIERSSIAVYSSDWAARSAIKDYGAKPERVRVVPFGANIPDTPDEEQIRRLIRLRQDNKAVQLLFIGVDWKRKGADIAVETVEILRNNGIETNLVIIGCTPPSNFKLPNYIENIPFLNKHNLAELLLLRQKLEEAHFFILPTQAEAFGIVVCEASAYGLPSFVPDIGGISTVVRSGINGRLLPANAKAAEYAQAIITVQEQRNYEGFALSSHSEFKQRLN